MRTAASALLSMLALSACATVAPDYDVAQDQGRPTVHSIVEEVECEIDSIADGSVMSKFLAAAYDVDIAILLNLDVTDDGALAPTSSFMTGPFAFAAGASYERAREQNFQEQLSYALSDRRAILDDIRKTHPDYKAADCGTSPDTNLAGMLGIKQAWDLALTGATDANWQATGPTGVFGGTVSFTVKKQITATGPTWTLIHYKGPGSFLTAYETNVDKLTFAFVAGPKFKKDKKLGQEAAAKFLQSVLQGNISTTLTTIQNKN